MRKKIKNVTKEQIILDIVEELERDHRVPHPPSKKQVTLAVNLFMERIMLALRQEKSVQLRRFGTFKPVERKARLATNPKTGQQMKVPGKIVAKFRPGTSMRTIRLLPGRVM